jgi:hypothetical protein
MNVRTYLLISGVLFCFVAILHFLRVISGWELLVGPWSVPMWVSWVGTVVPGVLSVWAIRLAGRTP